MNPDLADAGKLGHGEADEQSPVRAPAPSRVTCAWRILRSIGFAASFERGRLGVFRRLFFGMASQLS
jgi:hypothetical protein